MHVSRLYIVNYRSIRELDLRFEKGKNVIIGRNNCGKSNIIRALHTVLGETSPTYQKSENVALGDFHTSNEKQLDGTTVSRSANELLIWCELTREPDEKLDYDELYKMLGLFSRSRPVSRPDSLQSGGLPENCHQILDVTEDSVPKKLYVDPKLRNQATFEGCFEDELLAYAFRAIKDENDCVDKDIRFLFRETDKHDWFMAFKANVRNELLQSAIIHLRDPQKQLRLSSWTWYGSLCSISPLGTWKNADLRNALDSVRDVANRFCRACQG